MSDNVSLSVMVAATQLLSDNHRLTSPQIAGFINQGVTMLWDKLTEAYGEDYNMSLTTFTITSVTTNYALPTDCFKIRGIDIQWSGPNSWLPCKPFIWKDRDILTQSFYSGQLVFGPVFVYKLLGGYIQFMPPPLATSTIRLYYTPVAPRLVADGDTIDGINGWEQYIINFAAMQCLINERKDISFIAQQQAMIEARITKMAASRDSGEPTRVPAVSDFEDSFFPSGLGYGRGY